MDKLSHVKPSTLAAQALGWNDPSTRAVIPPLVASVPYERAPDGSYPGGHTYTRDQNPTYDQSEALLARLEGGHAALLFSSGMAAATTVFETLSRGAHVVAPEQMYWTIRLWLQDLAARGRILLDLVPNADLGALRSAVRPGATKIVWVETPSNPTCARYGYRWDGRCCARRRRAGRGGWHGGHTGAVPAARAGSRPRHAFGNQAAQRAF